MRIISTYVGNRKKSEISWRWRLFKPDNQTWVAKKLTLVYFLLDMLQNNKTIHLPTSRHCYFYLLTFFENFDHRYYLLTIWTEHQLNTGLISPRFFEPVPYNSDCIVLHSYQPATILSGILSPLVTVSFYSIQSRPSNLIDVFYF